MHQNTTHFTSKAENTQGSIGTTTVVPYSIIQIHGWLNPKVAETTGLTDDDLKKLFEALWYGTSGDGSSHSRTKSGQNSILLLEIVYAETNKKVYSIDQLIKLKNKEEKKDEQLRSIEDVEFDFSKLLTVAESDKISKIKFYTEIDAIKNEFTGKDKFEEIQF
jgi:CRISPR-associated protein Csh2